MITKEIMKKTTKQPMMRLESKNLTMSKAETPQVVQMKPRMAPVRRMVMMLW